MIRLAIVHWMPVEMYPPLINLLRCFADSNKFEVVLHTTANPRVSEVYRHPGVVIRRSPTAVGKGLVRRVWHYVSFNIGTFLRLLSGRPDVILYVEPASAFPVWLHSQVRRRVPLFIHHHEYHSPDQFLRPGMRLIRLFHQLEQRSLFRLAKWVSHTNGKRLEMFSADCPMVPDSRLRVFPNYPPGNWRDVRNRAWANGKTPFKFVYVGSLSLRDTFLAEFMEWLLKQPDGSVHFDVYAYNLDQETREFLVSHQGRVLHYFPEGIDYEKLPILLGGYHAGVILYKAQTLNYRFNETNKLFEYLICGLDVWFSDRMEGVMPHKRVDAWPRVIECNFSRMDTQDWSNFLIRPANLPAAGTVRDAESAYAVLEAAILEAVNPEMAP